MKISLIQSDIQWADPVANMQATGSALSMCGGSDLCVLPEMWPTGFCTCPTQETAESQRQVAGWLQSMADTMDCALVGSMATLDDTGRWRNRLHFIRPHLEPLFYDKRHLFTYGGEHLHYAPGESRLVVQWRGVRLMPLVCYDLRFPMWSRNRLGTGDIPPTRMVPEEAFGDVADEARPLCDVLLYVASWPASRAAAWRSLLVARAIENQCYACGVNRVGHDPACSYAGGTLCADPYGSIIASVPDNEEGHVSVEIDLERLARFRQKFPVLRDAD